MHTVVQFYTWHIFFLSFKLSHDIDAEVAEGVQSGFFPKIRTIFPNLDCPLFFRKIIDIERSALWTPAPSVHLKNQIAVTVRRGISKRSQEEIGDCEQSIPNHSPAAPTALPLKSPEKFSGFLIKGLHL